MFIEESIRSWFDTETILKWIVFKLIGSRDACYSLFWALIKIVYFSKCWSKSQLRSWFDTKTVIKWIVFKSIGSRDACYFLFWALVEIVYFSKRLAKNQLRSWFDTKNYNKMNCLQNYWFKRCLLSFILSIDWNCVLF